MRNLGHRYHQSLIEKIQCFVTIFQKFITGFNQVCGFAFRKLMMFYCCCSVNKIIKCMHFEF